jgi:hypothetical protein
VLDSDRKSRKVKVRKKGKSLGIKTLHVGDFNWDRRYIYGRLDR